VAFLGCKEARRIRRAFLALDSEHGRIEASTLMAVFQKQQNLAAEEAASIIHALNCTGGHLTYSDFAAALCEPCELSQEASQEAFRRFERCQREMFTAAADAENTEFDDKQLLHVENSEFGDNQLPRLLHSRVSNAVQIDLTSANKQPARFEANQDRVGQENSWKKEWNSMFHSRGSRILCCLSTGARH
jgi:hypothetical protein